MARVTGLTAERMLEIERNTVINAFRNVDGELIFTTYDGRQINVGNLEGRGIVQTDIDYQVSSSGSDTPVGVWLSEIPELTPGIYLWTRTTLHYTDETTSVMYSVARIGEDGTPSQDAQFPTTPTNLRLVSNTGIFTDQGTMAEIILEWDPVTQSTTGDFIDLAGYELYQESYSVAKIADGNQVKVLRPSGSSTLYRVLATSKGGVDSDLSPALTVVAATPGLILRDPNTPIVDSDQGVVTVRWDGSYLGTQNNDSASHVVVGIQNGSSWVRHGVPLYEMGTVNIASKPKTNVTAKLFAYDRLGRLTGESEAVTVTVEGTPFSSFDDVTQEYLEGIEIRAQDAWDSASAAVKSTLVEYAVGPSEIIAPSSGWSSDTPTRTPGSFIWMRTTVTYGDDTTDVFSPVLLTGNDGSPGRSITDVDVMYYSSTSSTTLSGGSWQTTSPAWAEGRYIWSKTVTFYSTGDPTETDPVCITGDKGATGSSGKGISSTVVSYANSTNGSTTPTSGWQTTLPTVPAGNYLWTRTVITYTDNATSTAYSVAKQGEKGATGAKGDKGEKGDTGSDGLPGAAGVGLTSTEIRYAKSTSGTTAPTSGWQTSVPTSTPGQYLWTRTVWTYSDTSTETGYSVAMWGATGSKGDKGDTGTDGIAGKDGVGIKSTAIAYAQSTSGTTAPSSGWQASPPPPVAGRYVWTRTIWTYDDDSTETGYSVGKIGDTGSKGDDGSDGDDGVGVSSIIEEYYLSTSATAQTGGSWGTSVPGWVDGRYYWTRSKITYTNGDVDTTKPKNVTGGKGSTGATGVSVTSVVQFYQVLPMASPAPAKPANSVATPPSPWQLTEPDYVEDTNLWVVTRVNFSNSTRSYSEVSKVSAYTAASTAQKTNMKILRTVDGLNRVFVSEESPGSGYIGYENLAPPIVGSGNWAEVRRSYVRNPVFTVPFVGAGLGDWAGNRWFGNGGAGVYSRVTDAADGPLPGVTTYMRKTWTTAPVNIAGSGDTGFQNGSGGTAGISVTPGEIITASSYMRASVIRHLRAFIQFYDAAGASLGSRHWGPNLIATPGMWERVHVTVEVPAGAAYMLAYSDCTNTSSNGAVNWSPGDTLDGTALLIEKSPVLGPYFDGSSPDRSVDPDMRQRWLGAENNSASVMEGEAPSEWIPYRGSEAVIISRDGGGIPRLRVITDSTEAGSDNATGVRAVIGTGYPADMTVTGTIEVSDWGTPDSYRPVVAPTAGPPLTGLNHTVDPGSITALRHYFTGLTVNSNRYGVIRSWRGEVNGQRPDFFISNIGLYIGTLPDDAEPLHNGDLWFRTGWKEQDVGPSTYGVQEVLIWNGQDWVPYKLVVDSLAAANSVTTATLNVEEIWGNSAWLDQLEVGVITTNMLSSKFGDDLDISSNSSITLMVGDGTEANPGRLQELDTEIGKVDSKVDDTTNLITGDGGINEKIKNLDTLTDKIQAAFRIETDKVSVVAVEGAPNRLDIYPDAIRMVSEGVTVAEITQEHIEIKAGKFTEAIIGNHLMTTTPDGRTIFTPKDN